MPFNGSNSFSIINTFVPGTTILSSAVNANFSDIATGLSDCVTRDAQGAVTGNLLFSSTGYLGLPSGTTGQRPSSPSAGWFRYSTTNSAPEFYDGTNWDSLAATVTQPQGYLTLTSGTPIISSDVTAATAVYYTPYVGSLCPIYNGTNFVNQSFSEQTLTLVSQHLASTIYDVFAFLNAGVFTVGTGPAWSSSAAGSGSRGTGAGTTQLQRLNGIMTNQVSITARNGSSTYTVSANQGTYLGSILIDGSAGQATCHVTYGQNRKWALWNAYNRTAIKLLVGDPSSSWVSAPTTWRASNGTAQNGGSAFCGLAYEIVNVEFMQNIIATIVNTTSVANIGIGVNSTSSPSGLIGLNQFSGTTTNGTQGTTAKASHSLSPTIGLNNLTCLEQATSGTTNNQFNGQSNQMRMTISWLG